MAAADSLLEPLSAAPSEAALVFDVDGTLAPIVLDPAAAVVPPETRAELARLARTYALVACVSGRPGDEARRIVGLESLTYVGNHGLELDPAAANLAPAIARFRESVRRPAEDKGLTLSFHYRDADDEAAAVRELEAVASAAREAGLEPRWGRKVLEIRPPVPSDKGTAVKTLIERSGVRRALYAGDDTTDLDAFIGLNEAGLEHTVRIAVVSDEAPSELAAAADLAVRGPDELAALLRDL